MIRTAAMPAPILAMTLPLSMAMTLAACASLPDRPAVENAPPAPEGAMVALDQPVRVGIVAATPVAIIEDSRCPDHVRCIWAGRLIVSTRLDGAGWSETVPLILGEPREIRGIIITLASATPPSEAATRQPADYRFAFGGGE